MESMTNGFQLARRSSSPDEQQIHAQDDDKTCYEDEEYDAILVIDESDTSDVSIRFIQRVEGIEDEKEQADSSSSDPPQNQQVEDEKTSPLNQAAPASASNNNNDDDDNNKNNDHQKNNHSEEEGVERKSQQQQQQQQNTNESVVSYTSLSDVWPMLEAAASRLCSPILRFLPRNQEDKKNMQNAQTHHNEKPNLLPPPPPDEVGISHEDVPQDYAVIGVRFPVHSKTGEYTGDLDAYFVAPKSRLQWAYDHFARFFRAVWNFFKSVWQSIVWFFQACFEAIKPASHRHSLSSPSSSCSHLTKSEQGSNMIPLHEIV